MSEKVEKVEHSLLELGAEVFRLRSQVSQIVDLQSKLSKALIGLRSILDEKGFVSSEDFDSAVDLSDLHGSHKTGTTDLTSDLPIEWRKRDTH